jgi:hypothetical protein
VTGVKRGSVARAGWREDMVTAGLSAWVVAGMVLDAWAHQNLSRLETFFTPWHAVLYSGVAAVMAWMAGRRSPPGGRVGTAQWSPSATGLAWSVWPSSR